MHVTVSNDGRTFSAPPMVTSGGASTFLVYSALESTPSGEWRLDRASLPGLGSDEINIVLDGQYVDGRPDGNLFEEGTSLFCAFGSSLRRTFSHFSPVIFTNMGNEATQYDAVTDNTLNKDRQMVVGTTTGSAEPSAGPKYEATVADNYDTYVSTNTTYEVVVTADPGKFKWRKYAAGMNPQGEAHVEDLSFATPSGVVRNPLDPDDPDYGVHVIGTYTNSFDYVYQLRVPNTLTGYFQWRKYPKEQTATAATPWSDSMLFTTTEGDAQAVDSGLKLYFANAVYQSGTTWTFTVTAEGSGRGVFSDPRPITTSPVELDLGVTVTFMTTANKHNGDRWVFDALTRNPHMAPATYVTDRQVKCPVPAYDPSMYDADPLTPGVQHELKVSNRGNYSYSNPCYTSAADGRTVCGATVTHADFDLRGPPHESVLEGFTENIKLYVDGYYAGLTEMVYEIVMASASSFRWRKYPPGGAPSGTFSAAIAIAQVPATQALEKVVGGHAALADGTKSLPLDPFAETDKYGFRELELGVKVKFATPVGKAAGDKWTFAAKQFWSSPYSAVRFTDAGAATGAADAQLELAGVYIGTASYTYELVVQTDVGFFKYRKYPYGTPAAGAFSAALYPISTSYVDLDLNVKVRFKTIVGKQNGDTFVFDAYKGHLVNFMSTPYLSAAVPGAANAVGDPRTPTVSGTYLGRKPATFTLKIGDGTCTTSCTQFQWKMNDGPYSALTPITSGLMDLAEGVKVQFGITSGYKNGNTYTITASHLPTTVMRPVNGWTANPAPASPSIFTSGVYQVHGGAPSHDALITLESTGTSSFKWKKNAGYCVTGACWNTFTLTAASIAEPLPLTDGLNLTFSSHEGFVAGKKYLIPLRTHIPTVANVSTAHGGGRALPTVAQPVPAYENYNNDNQGSVLGDVRPLDANNGMHTIEAFPASGGDGTGNLGVSNIINSVPTSGYATKRYPEINLRIEGDAAYSAVATTRAGTMSVTGTYAGTSSYVYQVQVPSGATNQIQWRKFAKGATPAGAYTTARSLSTATSEGTALALDQGVKVYFAAGNTYTENTKWEFTADKGHSFSFQEVGRTFWNGPVEITGTEQVLSGGVSVRFDALSGYNKDDHFIIRNRTIDAYGTYSGLSSTRSTRSRSWGPRRSRSPSSPTALGPSRPASPRS